MSWQTVNKILGLALIDSVFAERLLKDPREALLIYGIQLTREELEIFCSCQAMTLSELSHQLTEKLKMDPPR